MFFISSERLDLMPLSYAQLLLLQKGRNTLERSLGLTETDFKLNTDDSFMDMFWRAIDHHVIPAVEKDPDHSVWLTHWLIIDRKKKRTVGGIGTSGLPDEKGETFIGYFIEQNEEGKGFATEAVKRFTQWIFEHPQAKTVMADTLSDGFASQQVLQKNGFVLLGPCEDGLRWKLNR